MALKEFDGELDAPEDTGTFKPFDGSLDDDARQPLTEGVKPSNAGAGRGSAAVQVKGARDKQTIEAAKVKTPPVKPFVGGDERTGFAPGDAGAGRGVVNPGDEQPDRRAFTPGQVYKDLEGGIAQVGSLGAGAGAFGGAVDYHAIGGALKDFDAIDAGQAPAAPAAARVYGQGGTATPNPVSQAYAQADPDQRVQMRQGAQQALMRDQNFINDSVSAIKAFNAYQQERSGNIPNFTDIKTKSDFVEWAVRNGVATAPTMAVSMLGALAGPAGLAATSGAMAVGDMTSARATTAAEQYDPKRFTSGDRAADALAAQPEQTAQHLSANVGPTAALAVPYAALDFAGPAGTLAMGGAKGLAKKGAVHIAREGLKEMAGEAANEGGQEVVNVASDIAAKERPGQWTSEDSKRVFNSATVGSLMGAGGHASNVAGDAVKGMVKDQRTRSELERRANGGDIEAAMTLVAIDKGVMRPSELRGQSVAHFEDVAATHGLPDEAVKATKAKLDGMPADEIPGFLSRAMKAFDKRGLLGRPLPAPEAEPAPASDANAPDVSRGASPSIEAKLEDRMADKLGIQMEPIDEAAHEAATSPTNDHPEPTSAQKEAGNYKKGHVRISGMDVSIENPMGSTRKSKDDSDPWEVTMPAHYGYIRGTEGSDGDHVDLFIGGAGDNGRFWVVNQHHPDKPESFDEHKVVTGVDSPAQAVELYKKSFADNFGDKVFASVSTEFNADQIKQRLPAMRKPTPVTRPARTAPSAEAQAQPDVGAMVDAGQKPASSAQPESGVQAPAPAAGFAATPTKDPNGLQSTQEPAGTAQADGTQATRAAPGPDRGRQGREDQHRSNGAGHADAQALDGQRADEDQPVGQKGTAARLIANAGRMPNATEPITVHTNEDGTLTPHMGKSALVDFDSGEPITLPAGTSDLDVKKAIRAAGAVGKKINFYAPRGETNVATAAPAPAPVPKVKRVAPVRGSDALGSISARLGGISPDLLADLSEKVSRSRTGKTGKKTAYTTYDNPLHQGHGPLFRKGGSGDLSEIARVLEEEGFLTPGSDNPESQAQEIVKAELKSGGSTLRAGSPEAVDAEMKRRQDMASDVPDNLFDGLTDDDLAESGYAGASPEVKAATERLMADAEAQGLDTEAMREDAARGSEDDTEDQYHARLQAALTQAVQAHTENRAGDGGSEQSGAQASGADRVEDAGDQGQATEPGGGPDDGRQGRPGSADERSEAAPLLSSQSESDLKAKTERESRAAADDTKEQKRLADKAKADAQRGEFTLTGSDRAADVAAAAGQGDIFSAGDEKPAPTFSNEGAKVIEQDGKFFVRIGDDRAATGPFRTRDAAEKYGERALAPLPEPPAPEPLAPGITEHTTSKGNVLRGVVRTDLTKEQAVAIDKFTFKKDGGYFIREKHLANAPAVAEKAAAAPAEPATPAPPKVNPAIAKLREGGEKLMAEANADMGRDRETNTHRRVRLAASAEANASQREFIGKKMMRIADALEAGEAPALTGVTSRALVEQLDVIRKSAMSTADRAAGMSYSEEQRRQGRSFEPNDLKHVEYPQPSKWMDGGRNTAMEALKGKRGAKELQDKIRYSNGPDAEILAGLKKFLGTDDAVKRITGWHAPEMAARAVRLKRAGIENLEQLRQAVEQFDALKAERIKADPIKELERKLVGSKVGIDFFPTPKPTAERMVDEADIKPGMRVLEPSAGNGNIADAIRAAGVEPDTVEMSSTLREILEAKKHKLVGTDFMQVTEGGYDRIVMNPPFGGGADMDHVRRAYSLLKPGGRIVAIMSEGSFFRSDKKATEFREWLEDKGESEKLAAGTFLDKTLPSTTGVSARLVTIDKPDDIKFSVADAPIFYSELARQIDKSPMKQGTAVAWSQYLDALTKRGAVKADELEWTGLREWLTLQEGKVTAAKISEYLDANGVQVTETTLGARAPWRQRMDLLDNTRPLTIEQREELNELHARFDEEGGDETPESEQTKFGQYTLPGGENYREVLLTLPTATSDRDKLIRPLADATRAWRDAVEEFGPGKGKEPALRAERMRLAKEFDAASEKTKTEYKSGHWDQPNVLAHIRLNDRTDADGKRVLFVEELQSDWAQTGKKKGFNNPKAPHPARDALAAYDAELTDRFRDHIRRDVSSELKPDRLDSWVENMVRNSRLGDMARALGEGAKYTHLFLAAENEDASHTGEVPAAPFVGKTDAWVALAIKRVVKMAADEGYDRVAFVNGEQSADRYDLSKQVGKIEYMHNPSDDTYSVQVFGKEQNIITTRQRQSPAQLEELIGKDMAKKIVEGEGTKFNSRTSAFDHRLDGLDLKVGGEGMKAFYDKIVPTVAKDVLKKLGGGKLEQTHVLGPDGETVDGALDAEEQAAAPKQTSFDITPAMREKAAGGLPMFSVDDGTPRADTGAHGPASARHQRLVAEYQERLQARFPGAVLHAVSAGDGTGGGRASAGTAGRVGAGVSAQARSAAAVATVARRLFNHEVVFVKFDTRPLFNGAMSDAMPGVILINAESQHPLMAVLGHELLHQMRNAQPELYKQLAGRLSTVLKNEQRFVDWLDSKYTPEQRKGLRYGEELHADVVGDFFVDKEFWRDMAKDQPGLFKRVANAIVKFLDDAVAKMTGSRPFGTEQYLTDIGKARAAVVDAMRQFSGTEVGAMTSQNDGINLSAVASKPPAPPAETTFRAFQRKAQDQFNRFTVVREWAKEQGVDLTPDSDVWAFEERMHGRIATRVEDFREKRVKPAIQAVQKAGFTMAQVGEFLHAQHAEERNTQIESIDATNKSGSGMTTADANAILAKADPKLKALANDLRKITNETKAILLKAGIVDKDMTDAWEAAYKHYVPLKGSDEAAQTGTGKGLSAAGKQKRAMGHGERDEHIVENILRDHERAITVAEKNTVGHSLLAFISELGNPDIATIGQPVKRKTLVNSTEYEVLDGNGARLAIFDSAGGANQFITKHSSPGLFGKVTLPLTAKKVKGDPAVAFMSTPMLADNEVNVYVKGHAIRVQLNDELLARAYTRSGTEGLNQLMGMNRAINRYFSQVYTGYNPEFLLTNIARDFTTGLINVTGQFGAGVTAKAVANYPKAFATLLRYGATGHETAEITQYRAAGGSTGAAYLSDIERLGKDVQAAYDEYNGVIATLKGRGAVAAGRAAARKFIGHMLGWLEHINAAGESAMRLAVFEAVRDTAGHTVNDAASAAKNSTVNFNRRGEWGGVMGALYLFFNPAVQGTAAIADALLKGKHRGQAVALTGSLAVLSYALSALQFGGGDDDDDAYNAIPDNVKDKNIVIRTGPKTYITIPMAYGYGFFFGLGNAIFQLQKGRDVDKVALNTASNLLEHFSPVGNPLAGDKPDMRGLVELVPGAIGGDLMRNAMRVAANRNSFGSDIVPDSPFDPQKPDNLRMFRTSKGTPYEAAAAGMNALTGGTKALPGAIDVSPETLKYWTRTVVGGAGAFVADTFNLARLAGRYVKNTDDPDRDALAPDRREVPIVRRFAKEETVQDKRRLFWDAANDVKAAVADLDRARKLGDQEGAQSIADKRSELIAMAQATKSVTAMVKRKRDLIDDVMADDATSVAYKRARVKALEKEESEIYDLFVHRFADQKRAAKVAREATR